MVDHLAAGQDSQKSADPHPVDLNWSGEKLAFCQAAPQGFGDRHNTWAWTMTWWKGKLYVGTNRAWHCAERAGINSAFPLIVKYPPADPDVECTPDPVDLPLRAEIWCWSPETNTWDRLYQSPQEVPIPGRSGRFAPREVGFRDMVVFVEADGTEVLYVSGVNSKFIFRPVPAPRLLRSVDGRHFEPVPQEPGTFLGNLDTCTMRTISVYKKRFYVITGSIRGDGVVLESDHPSGGNDHFRQISPEGTSVFEMCTFNGYLYLGIRDTQGYSVIKTDAEGPLPYKFKTVVPKGAYLPKPSMSVISMYPYQGWLYIGTDRPGEIIRISPDDTWELVVGTPRKTPEGWMYPLSGLDVGFGNWLNGHIWRMCEHEGRLYIGTWNMATEFRMAEEGKGALEPSSGFDLYETSDGWHFVPVTTNGFGDRFNYGLRSFASTPHGLFLGTANKWYGLQIWQGKPRGDAKISPPKHLQFEQKEPGVLLSWDAPPGAEQYRIFRALVNDERRKVETNWLLKQILRVARAMQFVMSDLYIPALPDQLWIPGMYEEIGTTKVPYFHDLTAAPGQRYLYFVKADGTEGYSSSASNLAAVPGLIAPVAFETILEQGQGEGQSLEQFSQLIQHTRDLVLSGALDEAEQLLSESVQLLTGVKISDGAEELRRMTSIIMLLKLKQRVSLFRAGLIDVSVLL